MGKRTPSSYIIDDFLVMLGFASALSLTLLAPNSLVALEKPLLKLMKTKKLQEAKRIAQYMKAKKLITVEPEQDGSFRVTLTEKGYKRVQKVRFERLEIPDVEWDKKWRIFTFDIPEKHKSLRDFVSYHVKRAGFRQLQRSVFVFPYPIDGFTAMLRDIYPELQPYTITMTVEEIDNHNELVKAFKNII